MATKPEKTQLDKDLEKLYTRAAKEKTACECPECGKHIQVDIGGDFSEMARAMELRIKYEAIKRSKGGTPAASFFDEPEETT